MPRKKSLKKSAEKFGNAAEDVSDFISKLQPHSSKEHDSWIHEYAMIRIYREFEQLMLESLIGAINNDTSTISATSGIQFPKHLTDEVCEFLLVGNGYFDFKGRDGLIGILRRYVPSNHYLLAIVKKPKYKQSLEQLAALRNYAAHASTFSKSSAKRTVSADRIGSAGSWLKVQGRFEDIIQDLKAIANEIEDNAPY